MKELRRLEAATTEYFVLTTLLLVLVTVGGFALVLGLGLVGLESLTKFVDATFKTVAVLIGAAWALNRYFVGRIDVAQLRIDPVLELIPPRAFGRADIGLLVYRLDIVNTGKTLIPMFHEFLEIDEIGLSDNGVTYRKLLRWPPDGLHPGGPIEPGSWSAINDAIPVPAGTNAARVYLEVRMKNGARWTWHRSFALTPDSQE